jgi:DNA polymerase-3 subunit delta'
MVLADFASRSTAVELLQRSLSRGRLGHAYLLSGEDLKFLEDFGMAFVKTLFCERSRAEGGVFPANADACDSCGQCRKVVSGNHPDIHILRPESKMRMIRMEPTQEFIRRLQSKAYEGRYKVGFIVAVDRMNTQAANAFLKTLEEPPPRTVFILLTTEHERLLDTVISRCLRLHFPGTGDQEFPPLAMTVMEKMIEGVKSAGKLSIMDRYALLSTIVDGLKTLNDTIVTEIGERSSAGNSGGYQDIDSSLAEKYETELKASIEAEYRLQRSRFFQAIQWLFRDIWLLASHVENPRLAYPQWKETLDSVSRRITTGQALENINSIEKLQQVLHTNVQEALAIEVCFLKLHF